MNAIIIAAGKGTRLRPLTLETPKPLVKVFDKAMIEYSIEYLIQSGIKEIIILVGYLGNKFSYLENKYTQVKIIFNDNFNIYNNIYSLYLARNFLEDSFLLEGDIFMNKNLFKTDLKNSTYFAKKLDYYNDEWQLLLDENQKVKEIKISGENNYILSGISFWTAKDSDKIKKYLELYCQDKEKMKTYFWDDIIVENINEFDISLEKLNNDDIYEIDNLEELKALDESYKGI